MSDHILNIINHLLAYSDPYVTDSPHQRAFDHTKRIQSIPVSNPYSSFATLAPGASLKVFDGTIASGLTGSSVVSISLLSAQDSMYKLNVSSGPSSFKTARSTSGITTCQVIVNNNAIVSFNFAGATLSGVVPGDILRIKGQKMYDAGPYAFSPLNSGIWKIVAVAGSQVSCTRQTGELFEGTSESVASAASDVQFYADDGVQKGHKFVISGTFSPASFRAYQVSDATPTSISFVSSQPIPLESNLSFVPGSIVFYKSIKKLIYIEVDQDAVVRFDADTTDNNRVTPIQTGNDQLVGYLHKWGDSFSCEIVNKSVNTCSVKFLTAE